MSLSDLNGSSHCGADEMFISLLSCILSVEVDCLLISLFESAFAFKKCVALNSLTVFDSGRYDALLDVECTFDCLKYDPLIPLADFDSASSDSVKYDGVLSLSDFDGTLVGSACRRDKLKSPLHFESP